MDVILLTARLLLAAVFTVAGVAKLIDREGSRTVITEFGLPVWLAPSLGLLLPIAEIFVAALLIPANTAWWGALGSLVLLLIFNIGISINLIRGRTSKCHCFGQLHSEPVGWRTLARNGLFTTIAGLIVWSGDNVSGVSAVSWLGDLTSSQMISLVFGVAVLTAVATEWWLVFHLLSQQGRLLVRIDNLESRLDASGKVLDLIPNRPAAGLPIGSPAPSLELPLLSGEAITLDALWKVGKPVLLIFSDPDCSPCNALLPDIAFWDRQYESELTIALVSRGTAEANRAKTAVYGLKNVIIQREREAAEKYQVEVTPSGVLILPDGSIGSNLAMGSQAVADLVSQITGRGVPIQLPVVAGDGHHKNFHHARPVKSALTIGELAPSFLLPDLRGHSVELTDFKGRETLVLFWNPGCGFCRKMLPDLKAWESSRIKKALEILVISTGSAEANQVMGLRSTVVLDQSFSVGRAFGVGGTPSAVRVDAEGRISSQTAVGATAVLSLAGANAVLQKLL